MNFHSFDRSAVAACVLICGALLSSCGTNATQGTGNTVQLAEIVIAPANRSIPKGTKLRLSATGIFSDGTQQNLSSSVTWQASPSIVATIDPQGDLTAQAVGIAQVSAVYQGITGSTSTTVGPPAPVSIVVSSERASVPLGESEPMFAMGTFTDGTSQNLTAFVNWQVTPPTIASISARGDLIAMSRGGAQVLAAYEGITGSASITVGAPALVSLAVGSNQASLPLGESESLTATGSFSDGSTQNLTAYVTWRASPPTIASVDAHGLLKGLNRGVAQVSAVYMDQTASTSITVGTPALLHVAVSCNQSSLPLGESESMTATGSFSDGSTQNLSASVTWQASPSSVASIDTRGNLKALGRGVAQVSATYQGMTGNNSITVGAPALLQIAITPNQSSLPLGESESLIAIGNLSDGTQQNLTQSVAWASSGPAIAPVTPAGVVAAKALGTTTISATAGSVTGSASLTVKDAVIVGLSITPATLSLVLGSSGHLQAIATFSDETTQNVTSSVTWSSTQPSIVGVSSGVATAAQVGSATIRAESTGLTGSALLTVTPLMTVSYFDRTNAANSGYDGTVRLVNPGFTAGDICGMVYVFDEKQELSECCGCRISDSGLQTLSLINDLTANPLNGIKPVAGAIEIVPSNTSAGEQCDAGSIDPNSVILGWETNVQGSRGNYRLSETPLVGVPLSQTQAQVLASECNIMQQLGSGKGVCSCGSGSP